MSWISDALNNINDLQARVNALESNLEEYEDSTNKEEEEIYNEVQRIKQVETYYGLRFALCVDTKDPFAQGRVRFYLPGLHNADAPVDALPWAWPISVLGGLDDSGCLWVPSAGSTIGILFELGDRNSPFYIGTVWNRDRGNPADWGYQIPEYQCIHKDDSNSRKGYWVGKNDGSQVLPPNNTYNYNIKDFDDTEAFEQDTEALTRITPSHLYELKTPEKHHLLFDDGNYYCSQKWKHVKLGSSGGNSLVFWDDPLHAAGQQANPKACKCGPNASGGAGAGMDCGQVVDDLTMCRSEGTPPEASISTCQNDLFKHESEARPWRGPCTPQDNKCELQQTGVFLGSISGHIFVQDDEVEEPDTVAPTWELGTQPFSFGSTNKFLGKTFVKSATGHIIKLGDAELKENIRDGNFVHPITDEYEPNGITLKTASGHIIEMNDDTTAGGYAGEQRHIRIESTSQHMLEMVDTGDKQKSPDRMEGGEPKANADQAYVRLKTGYGLQLLMRDDHDQQKCDSQFIELLSPQKSNCHGPHILRMQENSPDQAGTVYLRCGGYFYGMSTNDWIEVVGDIPGVSCPDAQKASKVTYVSQHDIHDTKGFYVYKSDTEVHEANKMIYLLAGEDCTQTDGSLGPCPCPVLCVNSNGEIVISNRVYVSAAPDAVQASVSQLAGGGFP